LSISIGKPCVNVQIASGDRDGFVSLVSLCEEANYQSFCNSGTAKDSYGLPTPKFEKMSGGFMVTVYKKTPQVNEEVGTKLIYCVSV
jgi:hypothetical protein